MIDSYIKHLINLINIERDFEKQTMLDEIKKLTAKEREKKGRAVNNLNGKSIKKRLNLHIVKFSRL